ncbi:MAG: FixH family protein [Alphaproteobacteria bacterium]|nr:FixH family protein [Alphaproteobacteria bacterium]
MLSWFRPLTGWHVLALMVAFFAVTIGVNATFITLAMRTHPGEDVPRSYMQGVNYNDTLERRRQQEELGWQARFNTLDGELLIEVRDRSDAAVSGLMLEGLLVHSADTTMDAELEFVERRSGVYVAALPDAAEGQWRVRAHNAGELPFELEQDLWLP